LTYTRNELAQGALAPDSTAQLAADDDTIELHHTPLWIAHMNTSKNLAATLFSALGACVLVTGCSPDPGGEASQATEEEGALATRSTLFGKPGERLFALGTCVTKDLLESAMNPAATPNDAMSTSCIEAAHAYQASTRADERADKPVSQATWKARRYAIETCQSDFNGFSASWAPGGAGDLLGRLRLEHIGSEGNLGYQASLKAPNARIRLGADAGSTIFRFKATTLEVVGSPRPTVQGPNSSIGLDVLYLTPAPASCVEGCSSTPTFRGDITVTDGARQTLTLSCSAVPKAGGKEAGLSNASLVASALFSD
jgi:hypothetical protein